MNDNYIEELIEDFMEYVKRWSEPVDEYEWGYKGCDMIEHELRSLITKVILHEQEDTGVGEP